MEPSIYFIKKIQNLIFKRDEYEFIQIKSKNI
jgi:hypothetical protein